MNHKTMPTKKDMYSLFQDQIYLYPHSKKIYYDRVGRQLAAFVDYSKIKIFPLLHLNRIKVKNSSKTLKIG